VNGIVRLAAAGLAGVLSVVALSPRSLGWIAWIALVPLFAALDAASRRTTIGIGVLFTLVLSFAGLEPWFARSTSAYFGMPLRQTIAITVPPLALLSIAHGVVLGLALWARPPRAGTWDVVWCAALWTCWESLRRVVFPFFPAGMLALSQSGVPTVLQLASVLGIAGISFVVVAVNVGIASLLARSRPGRGMRAAATALAALAGTLAWGGFRLATAPRGPSSSGPRVVSVDVHALRAKDGPLERYLAASAKAGDAALIVWPESALSNDPEHDRGTFAALRAFVDARGVPLLAGGPGSARGRGREPARFNSAHLVSPGQGITSYHKRGLVPLAETWPTGLPFIGTPPPDLAGLDPGSEATVFSLGESAFGVLICFEITDAAGARTLARRGARFIVNLTNDAWFASSARPPHLPWAAVRAVESGLPVLRAANAGRSAVFDRFGRVVATGDGPGLFAAVIPEPGPTLYVRGGHAFLLACAAVVVGGFVLAVLRRAT
jgi:apolipoprotein N-acyltransferase